MNENKKENKLDHPCFPQPLNPSIKVWRYIDTSKLIDLLSRKSLFLSRLDLLGDPHEGSITSIEYSLRQAEFEKHDMTEMLPWLETKARRMNKSMFVSCWHCDDYESEAMWKLYCPDNKGVAIQTTYKKLADSVSYDDHLFIGSVRYIDYQTEWFPNGNLMYPVMHKRKAFQHEKEIRLVKPIHKYMRENCEDPPNGIYFIWDFETSIENIYVNPYSQQWYYEVIRGIIKKYECNINIEWSKIKGEPYY